MDLAVSTKTTADYSVLIALGSTPDRRLLVLDVARERLEAPDLVPWIRRNGTKWSCNLV